MNITIPEYNFEFKYLTHDNIDDIETQLASYISKNGGEIKYPLLFLDNIETYIREIDLGIYDIEVTYRENDEEILTLRLTEEKSFNEVDELDYELNKYLEIKFIQMELNNLK